MKRIRPMLIVFLIGLFAGILWPNLHSQSAEKISGLSELLLLQKYLQTPINGQDYFLYLLGHRGIGYLLGAVFGISIFGVPMSLIWMGMMGFTVGALLASSLISAGVWGFLLGAGLLLPQYLIYIPISMHFFAGCYEMSYGCWRNQRYTWIDYRRYVVSMAAMLFTIVIGFLLESYVNPVILQFIMDKIKFF